LLAAFGNPRLVEASLDNLARLDPGCREALRLAPELLNDCCALMASEIAHPLLLEALTCRAPAEALALLEAEDPVALAERAMFTGLLAWEYTPRGSLPELATRTERFMEFLGANRESLMRTGLPCEHFTAWSFLDALAPLYPQAPLRWIRWPDLAGRGDGGGPWLAHTRLRLLALRGCCPVEYRGCECGYSNVWEGLAPEDAKRMQAGREALLGLKIAVLRRLAEAARRQSPDGLWDDCLRLLTRALRADDAEFWLRMDQAYGGADVREGILSLAPGGANAIGGLGDLLQLIGWFEVELSHGLMGASRQALECLPAGARPPSYFDLVGQPEGSRLDGVLDGLPSLAVQA
jgi:hypothetical protein